MNAPTNAMPSPLAVQNAGLLQRLYEGGHKTLTGLADACARDKSNVSKSLKSLEGEDLVHRPDDGFWELTVAGINVLGALARLVEQPAEPVAAPAASEPDGVVNLHYHQISPDPENPRRDFDSDEALEALEELAQSIFDAGEVLQNLLVRPMPNAERFTVAAGGQPRYQLVAGERRWRAVGLLIADGRVPADFPIPCKVRDLDDARTRRLALIENLKRVDLKPMEEARAFKALTDDGMSTLEIAVEVLSHERKQRYVQQRLQLLELSDVQMQLVDSGGLTIKEALDAIRNRPKPIEVTDSQALLFLEIADAIAHAGGFWCEVRVGYEMEAASKHKGQDAHLLATYGTFSEDRETGGSQFRFDYGARKLLHQLTGSETLVRSALTGALDKARLAVAIQMDEGNPLAGGDPHKVIAEYRKAKRYFTAALNKPFAIDPDRKHAANERRKVERERQKELDRQDKERRKQQAQADAEQERRKASVKRELGPEGRRFLGDVLAFQDSATHLRGERFQAAFAEFLAAHEIQVPFALTWNEDSKDPGLRDAQGRPNVGAGPVLEARRRIIAIAINFAAGLAPDSGPVLAEAPWAPGGADEQREAAEAAETDASLKTAEDRAEFVGWMAARLQDCFPGWKSERCRARAGHVLDDSLKADGIEFGATSHAWHRLAAEAIADDYANGLDDHLDEDDPGADGDDDDAQPEGDGEFED